MAFDFTKFFEGLVKAAQELDEQEKAKKEAAASPRDGGFVTKEYHDHALRDQDRRNRVFLEGLERRVKTAKGKLQIALGYNDDERNRPTQTLDQVVDEVVRVLNTFKSHAPEAWLNSIQKQSTKPSMAHVFDTPEKVSESTDAYVRDLERQQRADEKLIASQAREINDLQERQEELIAEVANALKPEARFEPGNTGLIYSIIRVLHGSSGVPLVDIVNQHGVADRVTLSQWFSWEIQG